MMKLIGYYGSFVFYCWKSSHNLTLLNSLTELPCCIALFADVHWQCDLCNFCYDNLLEGRRFNVELYETVMFIRLFNDGDLTLQIICRRMRNDNVIMISELVKVVGESIVANTNYWISMRVQRKTTGNLIQDSKLYDRDFNRKKLNLNHERFTGNWHKVIV
jgi:hypothetical protein